MKNEAIREYASHVGHEIIGKLERHPELELKTDPGTLQKVHSKDRAYLDEANNEYYIGKNGVCIITADGGVI